MFKKSQHLICIITGIMLILIPTVFSAGNENENHQKPNIIFIMTDDMSYEAIGYNSAKNYKTPHIDRLAEEGHVFTNCDAQPLCAPTRVKLVTGQYNYRNYKGWLSFDLEFPAIGTMLQEAGYKTGIFGKWHLGRGFTSPSPEELGFDEHCLFSGSPEGISYADFFKRYFYNCPIVENGEEKIASYAPDKFNQSVLSFIDRHKNKANPFFIYYPLSLPHNPFEPTPDSEDPSSKDWQRNFEDMVTYADKLVGNVIRKLKMNGIYDNTIIFFTTDNGTKTLAHKMHNGELVYGQKGNQMHDGVHVPLFIKYDGNHARHDDLVDFTDFYPTLASIAGIPENKISNRLDGVSLHPVLEGKMRSPKPFIFSVFTPQLSAYIRDKRFKYYLDGRLYDLSNDPRELSPIYPQTDTPETTERRKTLQKWLVDLLNDKQLARYPMKERLIKKFGEPAHPKQETQLIRSFIFDGLGYTPEKKVLTLDISPFVAENPGNYVLEFSRYHGSSSNSGLTYADVSIISVKMKKNGKLLEDIQDVKAEMTTRINTKQLKKRGNPIIAFHKKGDKTTIDLGKLFCSPSEKLELEIESEFSNPHNQWGDRAMLHVFIKKRVSADE